MVVRGFLIKNNNKYMQQFSLNIPEQVLPTILEAVVNIHGLAEGQTPEERAKELVVQFLGDIVNQNNLKKAQEAIKPVDLSVIQ